MGLPDNSTLRLFNLFLKGPKNLITDVSGVTVGHCTLKAGTINTGVTAIIPHPGDQHSLRGHRPERAGEVYAGAER